MEKMKLIYEEGSRKYFECMGYEIEQSLDLRKNLKLSATTTDKFKPNITTDIDDAGLLEFEISLVGRIVSEQELEKILQGQKVAMEVIKILKEKYKEYVK